MENSREKLIYILREKCPSVWNIYLTMNQVNVILPNGIEDFTHAKETIKTIVKQSFPFQNDDVLFILQSGLMSSALKIQAYRAIL
jgi:hypothetical protein